MEMTASWLMCKPVNVGMNQLSENGIGTILIMLSVRLSATECWKNYAVSLICDDFGRDFRPISQRSENHTDV